jgi:uncharacterized membrane protein YfcA
VDLLHVLLLAAAGAVAGFLAGLFGVGGGILLVPILLLYYHLAGVSSLVATHLAFGTSLLVVLFTSLASARTYASNRLVVWRAVMVMGAASVLGAYGGSLVAADLKGAVLQRIFAVVVSIAAVRLLTQKPSTGPEREPNTGFGGLAGVGLAVGVLSSLAGVGGGLLSIPLMVSLLGFPIKRALGTSSATIVITAAAAVTGYVVNGWGEPLLPRGSLGYVDVLHALPLMLGSIPLASAGARTAHRLHGDTLRRLFAFFLLAIAVRMLLV